MAVVVCPSGAPPSAGGSGVVYVIDGPTKAVKGELAGDRDLAHYRTAIDAVLRSAKN